MGQEIRAAMVRGAGGVGASAGSFGASAGGVGGSVTFVGTPRRLVPMEVLAFLLKTMLHPKTIIDICRKSVNCESSQANSRPPDALLPPFLCCPARLCSQSWQQGVLRASNHCNMPETCREFEASSKEPEQDEEEEDEEVEHCISPLDVAFEEKIDVFEMWRGSMLRLSLPLLPYSAPSAVSRL